MQRNIHALTAGFTKCINQEQPEIMLFDWYMKLIKIFYDLIHFDAIVRTAVEYSKTVNIKPIDDFMVPLYGDTRQITTGSVALCVEYVNLLLFDNDRMTMPFCNYVFIPVLLTPQNVSSTA